MLLEPSLALSKRLHLASFPLFQWYYGSSQETWHKVAKGFGPSLATFLQHITNRRIKFYMVLHGLRVDFSHLWKEFRIALRGDQERPASPDLV